MRKSKINVLKISLSVILILLLTLFVFVKLTNKTVIAITQSGGNATAASKQRGIDSAKDWVNKKDEDGKVTLKNPSAPTLSELVDPSQVRDGGIYITHEDLLNIPSLFCSAKGVPLPGMGSTIVRSGGREASTTDQGKETAYLTANDIPSATVFRNLNEWTPYGATYTTKYEDTTSKTIAKFNLVEVRKCTPAEAWVLAEFDNNVPNKPATIVTNTQEGTTNDNVSLEIINNTNEEYTGEAPRQEVTSGNSSISTFIDSVRNITKYAKSNNYEYGNLDIIPEASDNSNKKINNTSLIKWALFSCGFDATSLSIEEDCVRNNFVKNEDVSRIQPGDILFLNKNGEEGIVVFAAANKVYDLSSKDKIRLENEYDSYSFQPIRMTIDASNFKYSYRVANISGTRNTVATPADSSVVEIDGVTLYIVGEPGEERYVRKEGDKYYYVEVNNDYAPYTYVQYAWWKEKTVGPDSSGVKDTDLANEAEDFENYIKEVTGVSDVGNLERNSDTTFKIDYKVSMEPEDTTRVKTRFNNVTNKYIVGPFKVNYLRSVTKQGSRPKISFSGISSSILVGTDTNGNELLDSEGNSLLQLGRNYRFVYSNTDDPSTNFGHDTARNKFDTDEDYPYPSSGEEFYIEINYIDDLAFIKNFKFDFQYLTAGGEYEYYKGNFLKINWTQGADVRSRTVSTGSTTAFVDNANVAISSRAGSTSTTFGGQSGGIFSLVENRTMRIADPEETDGFGGTWRMDVVRDSCWANGDYIYVKGHVATNWWSTLSDQSISLHSVICSTAESISTEGVYFTVKFKRDYTKARVNETHTIKVKALITSGTSGYATIEECDVNADLFYENKLIGDSVTVGASGTKVSIRGDKIFVRGFISRTEQKVDFDAKMLHTETPQTVCSWWIDEGDALSAVDQLKGVFQIEKPGTCVIGCATGEVGSGVSVEVKTYKVIIPKLCFNLLESREQRSAVGSSVSFYNAMGTLENEVHFGNNSLAYPVVDNITDGQIDFMEAGNFANYMDSDYQYTDITFIYTDDVGSMKATVSWEPRGSDGSEVTDGTGENGSGGNGSGENGSGGNESGGNGSGENGSGGNGSGGNGSGGNGSGGNGSGGNGSGGNGSGGNGSGGNGSGGNGSGGNGNGGNGSGGNGNGGNGSGGNGNGGNGSGGNGSGGNGSGGNGNGGNGSGGNGSGGNGSGGNGNVGNGSGTNTEYSYCYYLRATSATILTGQDQINAVGSHEVIDVDAGNGLEATASGVPVELEMLTVSVNLRTSMAGMVWIDQDEDKKDASRGKLGIYDGNDKPADKNSVEIVIWKVKYEVATGKEVGRELAIAWDDSGKEIDFVNNKIYIDDKGEYKIPHIQVPSEEGLDGTKYVMSYDVEFIYNGEKYEATEYLVPSSGENKTTVQEKLKAFKKTADQTAGADKDYAEYAKSSYIVENASERYDFDKYFTEIYGHTPITDDGNTEGRATGGKGGSYYANVVNGETQNKEAELKYDSEIKGQEGAQKTKSNLIKDENGYVLPQYRFTARTSEAGLLLPYERLYHVEKNYDNYTFQSNQYKPVDEYFHQINLGLLERREADLSVIKDLYTANVVVNEHLSTYHYNKLGQIDDEALTIQETLGYREQKYTIDLYNSDYYYRSSAYSTIQDDLTKTLVEAIKEGSELQVFLTYRIQFTNESSYMNASINEFKDYYDSTFTLITNEMCTRDNQDSAEGNEVANEEGKFQKYVSSLKAAGDEAYKDVSREPRTVAYAPYYRKLTDKSDPKSTSTSTSDAELTKDYYWNRDDDLDVSKVAKLERDNNGNSIAGKIVDVVPGKDEGGYNTFTYAGLKPEKSIKNGQLPASDPLVIEPNETIEFYVSYQVDLTGYQDATGQSTEDANKDADKDKTSAKKDESGDILEAAKETIREKLTGEKSNIVEITRYSTGYNNRDNPRHNTINYRDGNISGRVDQDSAPDNMDIKKVTEFKYTEDDNEYAPKVQVSVSVVNDSRELNGTVWEDLRGNNGVGNGIYDSTEEGIKDIDVTMVEKIRITKEDLKNKGFDELEINSMDLMKLDAIIDNEFEYIWKDGQIPDYKSQITSDENGNYKFTNFPTGTFVVRFEYGNNVNETDLKYNGQDYKNTTYQVGMKNPSGGADNVPSDENTISSDMEYLKGISTLNNEWHDLSKNDNAETLNNTRVSDARDYEPQRMRVIAYSRTITNKNAEILASNIASTVDVTGEKAESHVINEYKDLLKKNQQDFVDNTRMVANTAKLYIDVEKQDTIKYKTIGDKTVPVTEGDSTNGDTGVKTDHTYVIKNIDFGLVERPETRINIRKEINEIQLLKNDGKEVILAVSCDDNGNLIKDGSEGNGTVRLEKVTEITKEALGASQGFKYIAMESKMLNGLQVKLTYRIEVINDSEEDYVGTTLGRLKNIEKIYKLADNYENRDIERLYSAGENDNVPPFINGKGIIYGKYLGTYYYTNNPEPIEDPNKINEYYAAKGYEKYEKEIIVKTTIDQVIDYIDNDLSISLKELGHENSSWVASSDSDRKNKLSEISYQKNNDSGKYEQDIKKLQDDKERAYVTKDNDGKVTKNNLYLSTNDTMTYEPIDYKYTRILMEENTKYPKVLEKNAEVKDETVGKITVTEPDEVGNVEISSENKKTLKFLSFETDPVPIDYLYTTDDKGKNIIGNTRDNSNTDITSELVPKSYKERLGNACNDPEKAEILITTSAQASEEAINNMNYDNLVEIVMYSNSVGRRDMQTIPGNANMIAKDNKAYLAGYIKAYHTDTKEYKFETQKVTYTKDNESITVYTERDAYAARDTVTFSEPTGLSLARQKANKTIRIILVSLLIAATAIVAAIVVTAVRRNKYDDNDILKTKN